MLYSVEPKPLTNHKKTKSRFLYKIFKFFNDHYTGQTFFVAQYGPKITHLQLLGHIKNESVLYLENTKIQRYMVRG